MKITVNGAQQDLASAVTVSELLKINKVEQPQMVSVQLNGEFLDRDKFDSTNIKDNDTVDFLYFMGGGR